MPINHWQNYVIIKYKYKHKYKYKYIPSILKQITSWKLLNIFVNHYIQNVLRYVPMYLFCYKISENK